MKLDLTEILGRVGMRYPYEVAEAPIVDEDLECTAPIQGRIVFTNTGDVLLAAGNIGTTVALPCSRCLVYYEEPVQAAVDERFALETRPAGPRGRPVHVVVDDDENPDAGRLFDGALFDLTELLRQDIMLSLPTRPLHDGACKGLCATCGQDLNAGPCGCAPATRHPGLAALAEIRSQITQKHEDGGSPPA